MVRALRWLGGGLLGLLGLVLAVLLAWVLTQGPDAAPRPLPAALELPRPAAPTPAFQRIEDLLAPDDAGPVTNWQGPPLVCDRDEDCATLWSREVDAVAAQLQANALLGARCDAALAAFAGDGPYVERLPESVGFPLSLPAPAHLRTCQSWLVGQALVAAGGGDEAAALRRLQQSHDWARGALLGARSLLGNQVAIRQGHVHLQAVAAVALLQPGWVPRLDAVVPHWPDDALNPARWMPLEAAIVRAAIDAADASCRTGAGHAGPELAGDRMIRLTDMLCRHRIGWHPEATRQFVDAQWLERIERLRDGPHAWLEAARQRAALTTPTDDHPPLVWRNTIGVLAYGAGERSAALDLYIASPADLALHREVLAATLALRGAGVLQAEREAWLASSGLLPPDVLARIHWEPDGRALRWQTWEADLRGAAFFGVPRAPSRIPLEAAP